MLAYINHGEYEEAMGIYYELRDHEDTNKVKDFVLDAKMYATMIRSLTHAKNMTAHLNRFDPTTEPVYAYSVEDDDRAILENIEGDSQPALLTALTLFNDMRRLEIQPSPEMYTSMLKACTEQKDSYVLEKLHKLMRMDLYLDPDVRVLNQLMEAYSVIGDGPSALEIWDTIETSLFNSDSVSIVLKACLDYGYHTRANAIWNAVKLKQPELRLSVDDFNNYLLCVIRSKDMEKAEKLVQEGLANGDADESSVNTLEQYK
ncbi:uncharacterized protein B0P05DRAFT_467961 [Gilbertella persicaria]|nr:uncharacterized protein B0P05DRAFT_467961 [Gilbertella persicaria]KAI8082648.1 hypothetical protein B0P05DRAFT_467961 [Gilbertella persicaria]